MDCLSFFARKDMERDILSASTLLKCHDGRAVGRAFKWLKITQVVHLKNFEMLSIAELKTAEAVARAFGFEKCLRDDETQSTAILHIIHQDRRK